VKCVSYIIYSEVYFVCQIKKAKESKKVSWLLLEQQESWAHDRDEQLFWLRPREELLRHSSQVGGSADLQHNILWFTWQATDNPEQLFYEPEAAAREDPDDSPGDQAEGAPNPNISSGLPAAPPRATPNPDNHNPNISRYMPRCGSRATTEHIQSVSLGEQG